MPSPERVYPRASGGTDDLPPLHYQHIGLSPRERGNLDPELDVALPERSIPARAGEPSRRKCFSLPSTVYPRASGGT